MRMVCRFTVAAALAVASVGVADALPVAPRQDVAATPSPAIEKAAVVVTRRVVRRGPFGGRRVTVTKTIR